MPSSNKTKTKPRATAKPRTNPSVKKAVRRGKEAVRRFTGRTPVGESREVNLPDAYGEVGTAVEIMYVSDKGDGPHVYRHKFGKGTPLNVSSDGKWVLIPCIWNERGLIT